jgi:hypothetical protein
MLFVNTETHALAYPAADQPAHSTEHPSYCKQKCLLDTHESEWNWRLYGEERVGSVWPVCNRDRR